MTAASRKQPSTPEGSPFRRLLIRVIYGVAVVTVGLVIFFIGLGVFNALTYCVAAGTRVSTPSGPRPVESLRVGDMVLTRGAHGVEPGTIVATAHTVALSHLELDLGGGRPLRLTGSHPVATASGWTQAGELVRGASVELRDGRSRVRSVERAYGVVTVYDLTVAPNPNFYAEGALVHNKRPVAHESATIGDIRAVISAQAAYQSVNRGLYEGRLDCLAEPTLCVPGYSEQAPTFLDTTLTSLQRKSGYEREFHPGPPVADLPDGASPSSVEGYAYVALPIDPDSRTTTRAFCGDSSGNICFTKADRQPLVDDGRCMFYGRPDVPTAKEPERSWGDWLMGRPKPSGPKPCTILQ